MLTSASVPGRVVVVIDVIRAFTTAALAFERGATSIACMATPSDGRALRLRHPDRLLIGEVDGVPPEDFDLGNSPHEMSTAAVTGRDLIQATSNGTKGLLHAATGTPAALLAASALTVTATARWITANHPGAPWTLVCTADTGEDEACARHLDALLRGETPDPATVMAGIEAGAIGRTDLTDDLPWCCAVDRSPFAMLGTRHNTHVTLTAVPS